MVMFDKMGVSIDKLSLDTYRIALRYHSKEVDYIEVETIFFDYKRILCADEISTHICDRKIVYLSDIDIIKMFILDNDLECVEEHINSYYNTFIEAYEAIPLPYDPIHPLQSDLEKFVNGIENILVDNNIDISTLEISIYTEILFGVLGK
ncbi:MAG: hypothetical protein K2G70_07685 [Turicibacter sp.]|nr:hypothetical protein [Turicibacter sp.]